MKNRFVGSLVMIVTLMVAGSASSATLDISALNGNAVTISLSPGTYDVTPIGVADGGVYDAWNAWGYVTGCNGGGTNCSTGWVHRYSFYSPEFSEVTILSPGRYQTPTLALENSTETSFILSSGADVSFYIKDSLYFDNIGGVSLEVSAVPIPAAAWLFGSSLLLFYKLGNRKKREA